MKGTNKPIPNMGMGSSIGNGPFTDTGNLPTQFIGDGKNLIIGYDFPGSLETTYFCLKNVYIKDLSLNISAIEIPAGDMHFNFMESESKSFMIPDHIPKEQHIAYIKEQFNIE